VFEWIIVGRASCLYPWSDASVLAGMLRWREFFVLRAGRDGLRLGADGGVWSFGKTNLLGAVLNDVR